MNISSSTPHSDDNLSRAIAYSAGFHLALLVIFAVRVVFFPSEEMPVESAIRVDMVALPDKRAAQLPPAPDTKSAAEKAVETKPPPEPKVVEAPKPIRQLPVLPKVATPETQKVNLNKAKQDQAAALKRLEAMERIEKLSKAENSAPSPKTAKTAPASSAPIKGNEIAHGSALSGIARLDHDNYIQTVTEHVKQHWNLPRWLAGDNLRAVIKVFIDANGNVVKKQMIISSRNETFDERVMDAVEKATPFPVPPADLVNRLSVYGIDLDLSP